MAREYPRTRTPLTEAESALHLVDAYQRVYGKVPDRNTAELYLALVWNETSRGKSLYNYGPGNVIALEGQDFARPPWYHQADIDALQDPALKKRYQAKHDQMIAQPGTIPTKFRVYSSFVEGFLHFINVLKGARYGGTRRAAALGDGLAFGERLFSEGYHPDSPHLGPTYVKLRDEIRARGLLGDLPSNDEVPVTTNGIGWPLRAGHQYRIKEVSPVSVSQTDLRRQLEDSGASDVAFETEGPSRFAYSFTTPLLVLDYIHTAPVVPGARIESVHEVPQGQTIRTKGSGGVVLATILTLIGAMLLSSKGGL